MDSPLVSIIVPAYNAYNYIEQCIDSLLNQTYKNIEIIVVDDKSSDNTLDLVRNKYSKDIRVKIIAKSTNSGPSSSRNIGIRESKGKYIALLDSDDYYHPHKIEKQVSLMESKTKLVVCSTYKKNVGLKDNVIEFPIKYSDIKDQQLIGCPVAHPASMFRASFLKENNLYYDENYKYSEDYELFTRILKYEGAEFETIPEPLYYYRITGHQASFKIKDGKFTRNEKQWEVSKKIHYRVFSKLIDTDNELYDKKFVEVFLGHLSLMSYKDLKEFIKWKDKLILFNEVKNRPFNSQFLNKISKMRVKGYFLNKKRLSWRTLYECISVYKELETFNSKHDLKYIIKCFFFLNH